MSWVVHGTIAVSTPTRSSGRCSQANVCNHAMDRKATPKHVCARVHTSHCRNTIYGEVAFRGTSDRPSRSGMTLCQRQVGGAWCNCRFKVPARTWTSRTGRRSGALHRLFANHPSIIQMSAGDRQSRQSIVQNCLSVESSSQ